MRCRLTLLSASALVLATACSAPDATDHRAVTSAAADIHGARGASGHSDPNDVNLHPENFDLSAEPADDFYRFVNGGWMDRNEIPGEKSSLSVFSEISDRNEAVLHDILEQACADDEAAPGSNAQKLGDFYCACMDAEAIEDAGLAPIEPLLARIAAIETRDDLMATIAALHRHGIGAAFNVFSDQDADNQDMMIAVAWQGGLGLPDRDYYTREDDESAALRADYVAHVARMLDLVGDWSGDPVRGAATVMALETRLASRSMIRVEMRDPYAIHHPMSVGAASEATPAIGWQEYFRALDVPVRDRFNMAQPEFFAELSAMLEEVPLEDWKVYLTWHLVDAAAPTLGSELVAADFDFFSRRLRGVEEQRPRWKRCVAATGQALGEALGEEFVARTFSPAARTRAQQMVDNIMAAFRERLDSREWMSEETRLRAHQKLDAFTTKIGYPDEWRDYAGLEVEPDAYGRNALAARVFSKRFNLDKVGNPPDRGEWGMTPQMVNAYYNPGLNEIVFPAGIMQPPFFSESFDDAVNYGAMGAVIGHEISHGFDDQGSQYDAEGNLKNWWTDADRAEFDARADRLVAQFDAMEALPGLNVNGRLTLGENIGDFGGLTIAYHGYKRSRRGKGPIAPIDGFTDEQRVFMGWAQAWRNKMRDESLQVMVRTNPHAPARFRVLGPLRNMPEFHAAFGVAPGDAMWLPEGERVQIW